MGVNGMYEGGDRVRACLVRVWGVRGLVRPVNLGDASGEGLGLG